jgi:hypothetical protein
MGIAFVSMAGNIQARSIVVVRVLDRSQLISLATSPRDKSLTILTDSLAS